MLRNYLAVAFRNLASHRLHAAINIGGLAVGDGGALGGAHAPPQVDLPLQVQAYADALCFEFRQARPAE